MRKLAAIFCLIASSACALAATRPAVTKALVDDKGAVHILTSDGREQTIKPMEWQNGGGFRDVDVAGDGRTVGWIAEQILDPLEGGTNYAYPVGADVEVWRDGKVIQKFAPGVIQNWVFLKNGEQIAIHTDPPHGLQSYDCTRFDVNTGKKLAHWSLDRKDHVEPEWAKSLLENDPPPSPE